MGLTLPDELTVPMGWLGLNWPEADEDLLRQAGQEWISFAHQLTAAAAPSSQAARSVWETTEGPAASAFEGWWTGDDGPERRLSDDARAALLIGGALLGFAAITLFVKLSIIAQLVSLLALVAQAVATAFFTVGLTAGEIPGFIAASRLAVRKLLGQLVNHVETVVRSVLERARALLRRGRRVESYPRHLVDHWFTGGRNRPRDLLDLDAQERWAEAIYDDARRNPADIDEIFSHVSRLQKADGSPFTREDIAQIKQRLMFDEHPIEDYETGEIVLRAFDPDPEIAAAWERLRDGPPIDSDRVLLEHELAEHQFMMDHPDATHQKAHRHANTLFNWQRLIEGGE